MGWIRASLFARAEESPGSTGCWAWQHQGGATRRKVQQRADRRWILGSQARVKRWGKSPPPDWQQDGHGKPPREQDQIGRRTAQAARVDPTEPAGRSLEVGGDIHPRGMTPRDRTRLTDPPRPPRGGRVYVLRGFCAARTPPDPRAQPGKAGLLLDDSFEGSGTLMASPDRPLTRFRHHSCSAPGLGAGALRLG